MTSRGHSSILHPSTSLWRAALIVVVMFILWRPAAAQVTYSFVGLPFSNLNSTTCPPVCNISGSITVPHALPANLNQAVVQNLFPTLPSFSFTDGATTMASDGSPAACGSVKAGLVVSTDSGGNITYALFNIYGSQNGCLLHIFDSQNPQDLYTSEATQQPGYVAELILPQGGPVGKWTAGLAVSTITLPDAQSGTPYGPVTLQAVGGTPPYTWLASGLPQGFPKRRFTEQHGESPSACSNLSG